MGENRSTPEMARYTVAEAADMSRDAKRDTVDTPRGMPHPEPEALTSELRDRLRYVEGQLDVERHPTPKPGGSSPDWWSASRP